MQIIPTLSIPSAPIKSQGKLIIGAVHGKINDYWKLLQKHPQLSSIQVGDFGFRKEHNWFLNEVDCQKHKINFGNNDYMPYLNAKHSLQDYQMDVQAKVFTVRGAWSVNGDKGKTSGIDWFYNEQCSYKQLNEAIHYFQKYEPRIMITHDCPDEVRKRWFGIKEKTLTSQALQVMFEVYQPDIWIFGHHHQSKTETINGTKFICLNELETIII